MAGLAMQASKQVRMAVMLSDGSSMRMTAGGAGLRRTDISTHPASRYITVRAPSSSKTTRGGTGSAQPMARTPTCSGKQLHSGKRDGEPGRVCRRARRGNTQSATRVLARLVLAQNQCTHSQTQSQTHSQTHSREHSRTQSPRAAHTQRTDQGRSTQHRPPRPSHRAVRARST